MVKLFSPIISLLILVILLVLFLRNIKKQKWMAKFEKKWIAWAKHHNEIPLWQHSLIIISGFILSLSLYLIVIAIIKPHFTFIQTTAVNWFTVHHYPAQQDKIYFVSAFVSVLFATNLVWLLWILQKNKQ